MTSSTFVERRRLPARRFLLALSTILCSGLAAPALAESAHPNLDANGVDLVDGSFNLRLPVASIGSGTATLPLVVYDSQFDNWTGISVSRTVSGGVTSITINLARGYDRFTSADGYGASKFGTGATLTVHSNEWITYTTLDGTSIEFRNPSPNDSGGTSNFCDTYNTTNCRLLPDTIDRRGGMTVSFGWQVVPNCPIPPNPGDPVNCNEYWRLSSVSNDAGYAINWTYVNNGGSPVAAWFQRATAVLSNSNVSSSTWPTVTYAYPASTVMTVTTPGGKTWRITGNPGAITGVRRPSAASDTTSIAYGSGVVTSLTSNGVTTGYSRTVSGSTATLVVTDALSKSTTIVSDLTKQRPTSITDPLSRITTMSYDSVGRPTEITYPEGNKVQYGYDGRGNLTTTTQVAKVGSGLSNIVSSASYPSSCTNAACNQPTTTTDPRGNVTDYSYDGTTGLLQSVTAPAPTSGATRPQTRYGYTTVSGVSVPTSISTCQTGSAPACIGTADEVKTTAIYNSNLLPTSVSVGNASLTATTASTYDAFGNLLTVDGPLPGTADTTTYRYDADRAQLGIISADPDGAGSRKRRAVKATYNSDGLPTITELGTVNGTTDSDWAAFVSLQQSTASYDGNARKTKDVATASGTTYQVTQYSYDAVGRLECSALRMNSATWNALPSSACTLGTSGSAGPDRVSKAIFDAAGQTTKVQTAFGTADQADEASYSYTPNGQRATVTDANNNLTTYEYDGFDRLLKTRYPVATVGALASSTTDYEQLTYDATSNVVSRRVRDGQVINYGYDALGRLVSKDRPNVAWWETDFSYGYNLLGRMTSASDSFGHILSFSYDVLGRMVAQTDNWIGYGNATMQYDLRGRRTRYTWFDGAYISYDYDVTDAMTAIRDGGGAALVTFNYDDLGRRTSLSRANGTVTSYSYDAGSRLAGLAQNLAGTSNDLTLGFSYNPAGQIASRTSSNDVYAWTGATNINRGYTTNGLNQYTQAGAVALGYDGRGNVSALGSWNYSYTSDNQLATAGTGLAYDPVGRLFYVSDEGGAGLLTTYDGPDLTTEMNQASGALLRRYVYGPGTDEPLIWYEGADLSDRRWLHADERGSIIAVTNDAGAAIAINRYDDYGVSAAGNIGRFQYTGQKWLPSAGLYDYKARMYSPTLGRFMQTDPSGYADGMNWYDYVGGDPVNGSDPTGMFSGNFSENVEASLLMARFGSEWEHDYSGSLIAGGHSYDGLGSSPLVQIAGGRIETSTYERDLNRLLTLENIAASYLRHPYATIRITPENLIKLAANHFQPDGTKSYFNDKFAHPAGIAILLSYAISNALPQNGPVIGSLSYTTSFTETVGYARGIGSTATYTVKVWNTFTVGRDGKPIYNFVNIFPGYP